MRRWNLRCSSWRTHIHSAFLSYVFLAPGGRVRLKAYEYELVWWSVSQEVEQSRKMMERGMVARSDSIGLYYSLIWYRVVLEIWPLKDYCCCSFSLAQTTTFSSTSTATVTTTTTATTTTAISSVTGLSTVLSTLKGKLQEDFVFSRNLYSPPDKHKIMKSRTVPVLW